MNLIIDIGNTQTKASVWKNNELISLESSNQEPVEFITKFCNKFNSIENSIVSSVQEHPLELLSFLNQRCKHVLFFNADTPTPLENLYESKNTLGYDRLAACVGAHTYYSGKNILVVDAGTAITFDFVNARGQYVGGCISPGIEMRFKALHHFTKKLPHLSKKNQYNLIGTSTSDAIIGGVQNGVAFEVDAYIEKMNEKYGCCQLLLTGGDAQFIHNLLTNKAALHPNILLEGLHCILEFNCSNRS